MFIRPVNLAVRQGGRPGPQKALKMRGFIFKEAVGPGLDNILRAPKLEGWPWTVLAQPGRGPLTFILFCIIYIYICKYIWKCLYNSHLTIIKMGIPR